MTKTETKVEPKVEVKPKEENVEVIEDDEFEEFEDNMAEGDDNSKEQWEDDWDTEKVDDDFSQQLRAEIESHSTMKS
ncbi:hypothetical protein RB653_008173 [Dictyostelium firmibasis]|uniref:Uncharacterized protein n=1 Tax=Dictyostelium firmibasis TaxID=79012 RepID=A0AAN7TZF1_9MYCE